MTMVPLGVVTVVSTALAAASYGWFIRSRPSANPAGR